MTTIEQLGPDDWQGFRDIRLRALADAPDAFGVTLEESQQKSEQDWRRRLSVSGPILVVRDGATRLAMGAGWHPPDEPDRMMVWGMWTAPEARGQGCARSLLAWLLDHARRRDVTTVELHVTEGNDSARRLYVQCGFEATGEWEPLREGSDLKIELMRRVLSDVQITAVPPNSGVAELALRAYLHDVASRYHRRPATAAELEAALAEHPSHDLVAPHGVFLVATADAGVVCGCVALARVTPEIGEVRRLHVDHRFRRQGLGRRLMLEVEQRALGMGLSQLRLDTRNDLVESQRLYESLGYRESPPHSGGPYSDRWYAKQL
ncbi:GNAT family N-acetyltransferase [Nocardioides sp.]|uniref:GNAT family N-acetyltransferase n=1 Tax=Nocardioides sp. TaxID=35761 RepID=UPI002C39F387|nr:GNAT family N-acetyltransferase [Nocardioides sp.]HXH79489.1 GNAT family N-acetyltransferase [Nocardioides sp.]